MKKKKVTDFVIKLLIAVLVRRLEYCIHFLYLFLVRFFAVVVKQGVYQIFREFFSFLACDFERAGFCTNAPADFRGDAQTTGWPLI